MRHASNPRVQGSEFRVQKRVFIAGRIGLFIVAGFFLAGCSDNQTAVTTSPTATVGAPSPTPTPAVSQSPGAIAASVGSLISQLELAAPAAESAIGAGSKTDSDITAGLWAANLFVNLAQGQPLTASMIDTGVPAVDNVLQANLSGNNATAADSAKITAVINALSTPPTPAPAP